MRSLVISLFVGIFVSSPLAAADPTEFHKRIYDEINANEGSFEVVQRDVKLDRSQAIESTAKGWFKNGEIQKLEVSDSGEHGFCICEYYFSGGKLVFTLQTVTTEQMQTGKEVARVRERFYFNESGLFRWLDSDKKLVPKEDQRYQEMEEELLQKSKGYVAANGLTYPTIGFETAAYSVLNGSTGFKINPGGRFIVTVNALFRLNHTGLHSKVVPLVGLSYTL